MAGPLYLIPGGSSTVKRGQPQRVLSVDISTCREDFLSGTWGGDAVTGQSAVGRGSRLDRAREKHPQLQGDLVTPLT